MKSTDKQKEWKSNNYQQNKDKFKEIVKKRRLEIAVWFNKLKEGLSCNRCGFNKHIAAIHFHHKDDNKFKTVCDLVKNGSSKKKILEEIAKCEVLCANCHNIHHYEQDYRRCK